MFKEATIELKKPDSMTKEDCGNLHVFQSENGQCISLWSASLWTRIKFLFHGKLWLGVCSGTTQPPVWLEMKSNIFSSKE